MPLELEVALAYLRARPSRLVSSVSLLSIAGIALGVAALVVAMGLLSGYRTEIREKLIGSNAEVVVFPLVLPSGGYPDTEAAERRIARVPAVRAVAPVIYQAGVASSAATPDGADAVLKGVDPALERAVSEIDAYLPNAERILTPGGAGVLPGIAIGTELARRLDVRAGDAVTLGVPDRARETGRLSPRFGQFRVARIFRTNFAEYDSEWVFLDRAVLRALCRLDSPADVIEVRLRRSADVDLAARAVEKAAGRGFSVTDWRSMNGGLFSALALQQTTLFLVIGLIVAVSTFNVVATLVMTVQEKKRDIGVLSTLGAEPRFFSRVFVWLGALLGGSGVIAGILFGTLICWTATTFRLLSFPPGVAEIYFVSFIPFLVRGIDLLAIVGFAALAILVASWLPARRASRIDIAEALRYE
ncbi:MAG: ABC transporter permease [Acidobacteriota bacterium]